MQAIIFSIISMLYFAFAVYTARKIYFLKLKEIESGVASLRGLKQQLVEKQGDISDEISYFAEESSEIFILYDMTKAITRNFSQKDAFEIFQKKLAENVKFEKCELIQPREGDALDAVKQYDGYFLFSLVGKKKSLGYLAILGASVEDQEKIAILAHQFALTLQRIRLYQDIEMLAIMDSLTDVYTRRYILEQFEEELKRSLAKKAKLSIMMIDIDFFKRFNDLYGHLVGDQVLQKIAHMIKHNVREFDIVGRYGGEEFCVVLPAADYKAATFVAERIRQSIEDTSIVAHHITVKTTVSIGIASFPDDGRELSGLIEKADWALYKAKKTGRNKTCCYHVFKE